MARKALFIVFLLSVLGSFFYFRIYFKNSVDEPTIIDRLPTGDFLGKVFVLEVARELGPFLFYNKIPFRDFLSYEFLLAQGKNYGVDLQKPSYFFSNENGEWGAIVPVSDSSKIITGLQRLKRDVSLEDTFVGGQKVTKIKNQNIYMTYGKNWMFLYHGLQLTKRVNHVVYSKKGEKQKKWDEFLKSKQFTKESLSVYSNWKKIRDYGIDELIFSEDCDSTNMQLKVYVKSKNPHNISLKEQGISLDEKLKNTKALHLHIDISAMRKDLNHPLYKWLNTIGKRISFPVAEFLEAWEGDLTFHEGGLQTIKESYIETIMDDEFNTAEVEREKEVKIPNYAVLFSMNQRQKQFVSKLFEKGIMTKQNNRFRLLASPPLHINQKASYLMLYSADHAPKIVSNNQNRAYWEERQTKYNFQLDSLGTKEMFFSVDFPVLKAWKRNKFL